MAKSQSNGVSKLDENMKSLQEGQLALQRALAHMLETQAAAQQTQAALHQALLAQNARHDAEMERMRVESDKRKQESDDRFVRVEKLLLDHNRILSRLADTVGEKIGFKAPAGATKPEQQNSTRPSCPVQQFLHALHQPQAMLERRLPVLAR